MTTEQFRHLCTKLFGATRGWQTRCAERLGVDQATVSRYLSGAMAIPGPVAAAMKCWAEAAARRK